MKTIQKLQSPRLASDAEVGEFVMYEEECREVARKFQFYENGEVVMLLKPGKYTEDDIWHAVFATAVSWPTLLESQNSF